MRSGAARRDASPLTDVDITFERLLTAIEAKHRAPHWGRPAVLIDEADICLLARQSGLGGRARSPRNARASGLGELFHCLQDQGLHSLRLRDWCRCHSPPPTAILAARGWNQAMFLSFVSEGISQSVPPQVGFTWEQIKRTFGLAVYCETGSTDMGACRAPCASRWRSCTAQRLWLRRP